MGAAQQVEAAAEVELTETRLADIERAGATAAELRADDASAPTWGEDVDYVRQAELRRADEEDHGLAAHDNQARPETAESAAVAAETKSLDSTTNLERLSPRRERGVFS